MNIFFIGLGLCAVLGAAVLLLLVYAVVIYNRFISLGRLRDEAWSGILVELKKRHDLVPNLVEAVKGYAAHEKGLLEGLTERRAITGAPAPADLAKEESILSGLLGRVIALAEAYPDLKASAGFVSLQNSLGDIEESIEMARRYYNGSVRDYNILVESFPSMLVAGLFKFTAADFFDLDDQSESAVPRVTF